LHLKFIATLVVATSMNIAMIKHLINLRPAQLTKILKNQGFDFKFVESGNTFKIESATFDSITTDGIMYDIITLTELASPTGESFQSRKRGKIYVKLNTVTLTFEAKLHDIVSLSFELKEETTK
jgi:disulfide oxidoreductase YuzD